MKLLLKLYFLCIYSPSPYHPLVICRSVYLELIRTLPVRIRCHDPVKRQLRESHCINSYCYAYVLWVVPVDAVPE